MAEADNNRDHVELPVALRERLADLRHRLKDLETRVALSKSAAAVVLSFLALFLSDRIWETPAWLRLVLNGAAFAAVLYCAVRWIARWVVRPPDDRALSVLVQRRFRRLGDRLLGIIELAQESRHTPGFSPELYRAAIHQVATEALQYDFRLAADSRAAKRLAGVGLVLVCLLPLPWLLSVEVGNSSFRRWLWPFSAQRRLTLVEIRQLPPRLVVPHGEPFPLAFEVAYRSWWRPTKSSVVVEGDRQVVGRVRGQRVELTLPGQLKPARLWVKVGDTAATSEVNPVHRPAIKEIEAAVDLPDYLHYPRRDEKVAQATLTVLEGSQLTVQGRATRDLAGVEFERDGQTARPAQVRNDQFTLESMPAQDGLQLSFQLRDVLGLTNTNPWRLTLKTAPDLAPTVEIPDLPREVVMLESEFLQLKPKARDDFGVSSIALSWHTSAEQGGTNAPVTGEHRRQMDKHDLQEVEEEYRFSPALALVEPDTSLDLVASANDFRPNRAPTVSQPYRVHVIGTRRHAEMVRQQFEAVMARLEEVTRRQDDLTSRTREMTNAERKELADPKKGEEINELRQDQLQTAEQLERLSEEGLSTLREAARNPELTADSLKDWGKNVFGMQQISQEPMPEAAQALQSAQQNADQRQKDLNQALAKQTETLAALEALQRQFQKGLDDLEAQTLAQRLRQLAQTETRISRRLLGIIPETVGLFPNELTTRHKQVHGFLDTDQKNVARESETLQGEISRYFEHSGQPSYGQVSREMSTDHLGEKLEVIRDQIRDNIAMQAVQRLAAVSTQLERWADMLEAKTEEASAGGSGEGGGQSKAEQLMQMLIDLVRLRNNELKLRTRTDLAEGRKAIDPNYPTLARNLGRTQEGLSGDLIEVLMRNTLPPLSPTLKSAFSGMLGVEGVLAQPRTDQVAIRGQTKVAEDLSDAINLLNEQAKSSSNPSASRKKEMAFMMKALSLENDPKAGNAFSPNDGGNPAGGAAPENIASHGGDATGRPDADRNSNRGSGSSRQLPSEFREVLEHYFRAIEAKPE